MTNQKAKIYLILSLIALSITAFFIFGMNPIPPNALVPSSIYPMNQVFACMFFMVSIASGIIAASYREKKTQKE